MYTEECTMGTNADSVSSDIGIFAILCAPPRAALRTHVGRERTGFPHSTLIDARAMPLRLSSSLVIER